MVNWKCLTQEEAATRWDQNLLCFDDFTHSQTFSWGEYRRACGWRPYRWAAYDKGEKIVAMTQGLLRAYPGKTGVIWVAGGPVGNIEACGKTLMRAMMETTGMKRLYCRINLARQHNAQDALTLQSNGWRRTGSPLLSGMSMLYNPLVDEAIRLADCTRNWRHNLRRSEKHGLSVHLWEKPDIDSVYAIYHSMQDYKNLSQQFSKNELETVFSFMGKHIVLYRCDDEHGEPVSLRGCAIFGSKAWDLFAATSANGRKTYASYGLFWKLMQHCHAAGVKYYDMSGIDPLHNPGVYDFKKGTGALPIEYLGEWEWASSKILNVGANWMIRRRKGRNI